MRWLAPACAVLTSVARAQVPDLPTPPPPPPPIEPYAPTPPPAPPRTEPEPTPDAERTVEPPSEPSRFRFAPTLTLHPVGVGGANGEWRWLPFPAFRTGLRFAVLQRSLEDYSTNLALAFELGAERLRTPTGPVWAWAFTLRAGPVGVARGGMFIPYVEAYGLAAFSLVSGKVTPRLGIGAHFNAFALSPGAGAGGLSIKGGGGSSDAGLLVLALLALLVPTAELVWTPPNPLSPDASTLEARFGVGF